MKPKFSSNMAKKKIKTIITEKNTPYSRNKKGQADIAQLGNTVNINALLKGCINIGVVKHFGMMTNDFTGKQIKGLKTTIAKADNKLEKTSSSIIEKLNHLAQMSRPISSLTF